MSDPWPDRTYRIQVVGEQSGEIHHVAGNVPAERLADLAAIAREHGPKVAAVTAAARASAAFSEAMAGVLAAFGGTPAPRRRPRVRGKR